MSENKPLTKDEIEKLIKHWEEEYQKKKKESENNE